MKRSADRTKAEDSHSLLVRSNVGDAESIAVLRLNRADRANAYNKALLSLFEREVRWLSQAEHVRVVVITGAGDRAFCAGADLDEMDHRRARDGLQLRSRDLFDLWAALPVPTIAAVNGAAVGGGLELALACDIRVCAPHARFAFPELDIGLSPAAGGMRRLPTVIGTGRAKEVILFGRELDAATALDWGLVNYVGDDFENRALELATTVASRRSMASTLAKKVIEADRSAAQRDLEATVQALLYEQKHGSEIK